MPQVGDSSEFSPRDGAKSREERTEIDDDKSVHTSIVRSPSPTLIGDESRSGGTSLHGDEDGGDDERVRTPVRLSPGAQQLQTELGRFTITLPKMKIEPTEVFDPADFPESYQQNINKEKLIISFAENFHRQYVHLYRDRKPLLLSPVNELGVEKFVCTTIRPTELEFHELYHWSGAAEFVADYLNFVSIDPPHELPRRLLSPTTVLKLQKGNCFEYSTLLVSLLIGAGYDAYVVSGYASREVCLMDETREICPLVATKSENQKADAEKPMKKYAVRPPKDLTSRFERKQDAKRLQQLAADDAKRKKEEEEQQMILEQPPPDSLHGLRIHSWVLVLEGRREVAEPFFIEPLTGLAHSVNSVNYHGIESVWNHRNYWANMQDCSEGVTKLKYDLGDCTQWEYMFPSNETPQLLLPSEEGNEGFEEEEVNQEDIEKHLDLPPSWVSPICITPNDFRKRCPLGKKTKLYKRAKMEKFAPYLLSDGLVTRLSIYEDLELTKLCQVQEFFAHRADKLKERHFDQLTGWVVEFFAPGRLKHLREHHYKNIGGAGPESERTMIYYNLARVDGLHKRVKTATEMDEYFVNRDDFLVHRHVEYGGRNLKAGPAETNTTAKPAEKPIEKIIERYARNELKRAEDDVAEVVYDIFEEKINLTYHRGRNQIAASTREFIKPQSGDGKGSLINWNPESHVMFQADPNGKDKKKVEVYEMLVQLLKDEVASCDHVRHSEREIEETLTNRIGEESSRKMDVSIYDTERNEKAKQHRLQIEKQQLEEKLQKQEKELDYLAPFLIQMDNPIKLTRHHSYKLREDCLSNLKQRLIDKANLIQSRYEEETRELQQLQNWYLQNQISIQKADEQEYIAKCSAAMFRIHILEVRLDRHKELAPRKYMEMEERIHRDPRLAEYF